MEAQEQKQLQAKQSAVLLSQHHHIHLVCVGEKPKPNRLSPCTSHLFHCLPLQKREKRKEEEQRRKEWVDKEREKTLGRLRSFREVRLSYCLTTCQPSSRDLF